MASVYRLTSLASIILAVSAVDLGVPGPWGSADPLVNIHNTGKSEVCYEVEFSSGNFPTPTTCDSRPGFKVAAGQSITLHTGPGFNGALTAITNNIKGARHEINFAASPAGSCWYDVDYQLGMSDSTLGPADHRPRQGNSPSLSGEQDTLAKANAGWPHATNQAQLLQNPKYLQVGGPDGKGQLTHAYMDSEAPEEVVEFFQLTAEFTAYIGPGSVAGQPTQGAMTKAADLKSWIVDTQQMEIVAY
ncbi:hypothetical protein ACLMJK_003378 [Lecanora helva]